MLCIMPLLQLLLQTPVTPFSWDAKKWSVSWEELERMDLDTNMYPQRRKINHRLKVIAHHKPLWLQGFLSPFPLSAKKYDAYDGGRVSLCSPLYRRVPAQVQYHKWTMRLEITALTRLPESLTSWNKKRLPEEQLKKGTSPKVRTVSQGTFFS